MGLLGFMMELDILFASQRYNKICNRIRYYISEKVVLQILLAIILQ